MRWTLAILASVVFCGGCGGGGGGEDDADSDADVGGDVSTDTDGEDAADAVDGEGCHEDADCSNGDFCDGVERCVDGTCTAGDPPCDDGDPCTVDLCDADAEECENPDLDADEDGYVAAQGPGGEDCGGTDCDDDDAGRNPGVTAGCSDTDDLDCNGNPDQDNDADGHIDVDCSGDDCDDEDATVNPDAEPQCDGDHDCNGNPDDDNDDDGYVSVDCPDGDDCLDDDPMSYPREASGDYGCLDGVDNNCDGIVDNPVKMVPADVFAAYGPEPATTGNVPSIVWTGSEFAVTYDSTWGSPTPYPNVMKYTFSPILGVSMHGDTDPLTDDANDDKSVALSWTGTGYGLAWYRERTPGMGDDALAFMTADADWNHDDPIFLDSGSAENATIAWNGSMFGVCWRGQDFDSDSRGVFCNLVDDAGTEAGSAILVGDSGWQVDDERCKLVWGDSLFGLAWSTNDQAGVIPGDVWFRTLDADMTTLSSSVNLSQLSVGIGVFPNVEWVSSRFVATWSETTDYSWGEQHFRFVDPDGAVVGSSMLVTSGSPFDFFGNVVWTGSNILFAWSSAVDPSNIEIFVRTFDADGSPLSSEVRMTEGPGHSRWVDLAWTGSEVGVTFQDERDSLGTFKVYLNRVGFCD